MINWRLSWQRLWALPVSVYKCTGKHKEYALVRDLVCSRPQAPRLVNITTDRCSPTSRALFITGITLTFFLGGAHSDFWWSLFNNPFISFPPAILLAEKKGIWFWIVLSAWMQSRQAEREEDQRNYSIQERRKLRECEWSPFLSNWDVSLSLILVFPIWFSSCYYWSLMSFIAFLYFSNQLTLLGPAYLSVSKDQDRVKEVALVFLSTVMREYLPVQ